MDISKIYNANLILSNNYNSLCIPYKNPKEKEENNINLETALSICAKLCDNTPGGVNNKITLYGVNNKNIWRNVVVHIIQFINNFNKTFITVQTDNDFVNNEFYLQFLRENNCGLNVVVDKDINLDFLENVFSYKPLTKVIYNISLETLNNFYNNYLKLEELNCQNFDIQLNEFDNWTEGTFNSLKEQLEKVKNHIYEKFKADDFPLVPDSFKQELNKIIVKFKDTLNNTITFDYMNLITRQCGFSTNTACTIDQTGNIYSCCVCSLKSEDALCCGKYDLTTDSIIQDRDEFDLFSDIYSDVLSLEKESEAYNCNDCKISSICLGDCYSINKLKLGSGNKSSKLFCEYSIYLYSLLSELMMQLDEEKNELFKDFLFGCSFRGCFKHDR